jgi:hypothetical protein
VFGWSLIDGLGPAEVAAGDLDGDGDVDVARVSLYPSDQQQWYPNDGRGRFGPPVSFPEVLSSGFEGALLVELNGDGQQDLLYAGYTMEWMPGLGFGVYGEPSVLVASRAYDARPVVGDLDGDGWLDVAYGDELGVWWRRNEGGGVFAPVAQIWTDKAEYLVVFDVDGDLDIDVVSTSAYFGSPGGFGSLWWHENLGGARAWRSTQLGDGDLDGMLVSGDFDGDGDGDLLHQSYDGLESWVNTHRCGDRDRDRDGLPDPLEAHRYGTDPTLADTDGDGLSDGEEAAWGSAPLVAEPDLDGDGAANAVDPCPADADDDADGDGWCAPDDGCPSDPDPTQADLDGDGLGDACDPCVDDPAPGDADGDGWCGARDNCGLVANGDQADTDGDGVGDACDACEGGADGLDLFAPPQAVWGQPEGGLVSTAADLDGDGDREVLAVGVLGGLVSLDNRGGMSFGFPVPVVGLSQRADQVLGVDVDGDADEDVLVGGMTASVGWLPGPGGPLVALPPLWDAHLVAWSDVDGDGDGDVVATGTTLRQLVWHENLGAGVFGSARWILPLTDNRVPVWAGDLDGDGDVDLVTAEPGAPWAENLGGGQFAARPALLGAAVALGAVWGGDLDGDGDVDLVGGGADARWFENGGGLAFDGGHPLPAAAAVADWLEGADLDRDGDVDLVASSLSRRATVWLENDGAGTFTLAQRLADGGRGTLTDLDGDGDVDLVSGADLKVVENVSGCSRRDTDGDGLPDARELLSTGTAFDAADTDGDGVPDGAEVAAGYDPREASVDVDGDGVDNGSDGCPVTPDAPQTDGDGDGVGDACDPCPVDSRDDRDGDGVCDHADRCRGDDRRDLDGDGVADDCDPCRFDAGDDSDGDGVCDHDDACPGDDGADRDGDGVADGCDPCPAANPDDGDGDGLCDGVVPVDHAAPDGAVAGHRPRSPEGCGCAGAPGGAWWLAAGGLLLRRRGGAAPPTPPSPPRMLQT